MSDLEQLVRASRLYYELGETQNAIAEQLGVTRPQVSRLLKRARAEGIVEIGRASCRERVYGTV